MIKQTEPVSFRSGVDGILVGDPPTTELLALLGEEQRESFVRVWNTLPCHLRDNMLRSLRRRWFDTVCRT